MVRIGDDKFMEMFKELKSLMHSLNPLIHESYYISSFISGLKEDIKTMLKILKSVAMMIAFDQAKWQEESNNVLARKNKFVLRTTTIMQPRRPTGNFQIKYTNPYINKNQQKQKLVLKTLYEQRCRLG